MYGAPVGQMQNGMMANGMPANVNMAGMMAMPQQGQAMPQQQPNMMNMQVGCNALWQYIVGNGVYLVPTSWSWHQSNVDCLRFRGKLTKLT